MAEKKSTKAKITERAKSAAAKTKSVSSGHGSGFLEFIRTQGVIGLAVGLAIGTAAGDTVKQIVSAFIDPIVQFLIGSQSSLASASWTFEAFGRTATFTWGAALSSLITLLATALVIYWIIHIFKLDRLDKKKA